nr:hypothetical protein [Tanacetum cinerariifolium]
YSKRCWVYPIKKKSDVFEVFKVYKAQVELDSGKKIKCLSMDNGEQMNMILLERARAMLATTSLGKSFWVEAVNTTCYVINRPPSTAAELKTPMETWTGKPTTQQYGAILPIELTTDDIRNIIERTEAEQLKIVLKRSRQETHISQQRGSAGSESDKDDDDNDDEEELAKNDDEDTESGKGGDEVSERSEDESNDEENQELRLSEEARIQEEEEADELYRDVNINQGRGLQVTQNIEDSHVTLTPVHPDGPQESSSVSSFMTSMLNPISDAGALVEAYDADKAILDTYGESNILKRRREDDDQEGPSAGSDRGSKKQREGGEHASASTPSETVTRSAGRSTTGSQSRQLSASKYAFAEEPV